MEIKSFNNGARSRPQISSRISMEYGEHLSLSYNIDDFLIFEDGQPLAEIFDYWSQQEGTVPSHWAPEMDLPQIFGHVSACIDVSATDPAYFRIVSHRICPLTGRGAGWGDILLKDIGWSEYATSLAADYTFCRRSQIPEFHEIKQKIGAISSRYNRLILPVSDTPNGKVTKLYTCIQNLAQNRVVTP